MRTLALVLSHYLPCFSFLSPQRFQLWLSILHQVLYKLTPQFQVWFRFITCDYRRQKIFLKKNPWHFYLISRFSQQSNQCIHTNNILPIHPLKTKKTTILFTTYPRTWAFRQKGLLTQLTSSCNLLTTEFEKVIMLNRLQHCNPRCIYLGISPIKHNGIYSKLT